MKVFLDDVRFGNQYDLGERWYDWVIVRTFENCKLLLDTGVVTEMSLDYALSDTDPHHTGEDVLQYILKKIGTGNFEPPYITVHSKHSSADRMHELVKEIKRSATTLVDIKMSRVVPTSYIKE